MIAVRSGDEPPFAKAEQVVLSHQAQDALVVGLDALPMQFFSDAAIAVAGAV